MVAYIEKKKRASAQFKNNPLYPTVEPYLPLPIYLRCNPENEPNCYFKKVVSNDGAFAAITWDNGIITWGDSSYGGERFQNGSEGMPFHGIVLVFFPFSENVFFPKFSQDQLRETPGSPRMGMRLFELPLI